MAEQQAAQAPAKKFNMGLILKLVFVLVNGLVSGTGVYMVYASTLGWKSPRITEETLKTQESSIGEAAQGPFIYTMDKFTVNLDGEPKRTIRIEVNLEMLGKEGFEEVMSSDTRARSRDSIVRLLNDKSFTDLESIQGKLFLKDQIADQVNSYLKVGVVKDIYFSEFVVQ